MRYSRIALCLLAVVSLTGCLAQVADLTAGNDSRFIPIELWAGADWDGDTDLRPRPLHAVTGSHDNRSVSGPKTWKHPATGETLPVYERVNRKRAGIKRQWWAMRADGAALGRVLDRRPGEADRLFSGEALFPLGRWHRGERRDFRYVEYTDAGPVERFATLRIRRLDFIREGRPHSLRYDWSLCDGAGAVLFDERYTYSPGLGLVAFSDRLRGRSLPSNADCRGAAARLAEAGAVQVAGSGG